MDIWVRTQDEAEKQKMPGADVCVMPETIMDILDNHVLSGSLHPNALYTIKMSHFGWDIFWDKHKQDILLMKMKYNCELIPELYEALLEHWKKEHGNKDFLSLYQNKDDFFTDGVSYVYDHDYLHELVAYPNRPVYESVLKDGEDVVIDKEKFFALPFDQKVRMFREEISVIAAERWLIPPKVCGKIKWTKAYQMALRKTVTSLTKNWATEFIIMNIEHFYKPDYGYFEYLIQTLPEGETIMSNKVDIDEILGEIEEAMVNKAIELGISEDQAILGEGIRYLIMDDENELFRTDKYEDRSLDFEERFVRVSPSDVGCEHINQDGGGEGGAEFCQTVFKWKGKFYMMTYNYYSHHGFDFDYAELYEVEPKVKEVTVYV